MPRREFKVHRRSQPVLRLRPPSMRDPIEASRPVANERFKTTFLPAFWVGLLLATSVHYVAFHALPHLDARAAPVDGRTLVAVELPPTVSIPRPPEPVARPATPKLGPLDMSVDLTIRPTTFAAFNANRIVRVAPPPAATTSADWPRYVPFIVAPELKNKRETIALLRKVYPSALKRAGIGGTVLLWIYIDDTGAVLDCRIAESSGYPELDDAAQVVAHAMQFTPAVTPDNAAVVWISQPIAFIHTG